MLVLPMSSVERNSVCAEVQRPSVEGPALDGFARLLLGGIQTILLLTGFRTSLHLLKLKRGAHPRQQPVRHQGDHPRSVARRACA